MHRRRHGRRRPVRGGAVRQFLRYPFLRNDPGGDVDIEITADGLRFVTEGDASQAISLSETREVRLFCGGMGLGRVAIPTRVPTFAYCCEIRFANGKRVVLTDLFRDVDGKWVVYSAYYRAFILLLHQRLHLSKARVRYRSGVSWISFLFWDAFMGHWTLIAMAESRRDGTSFLKRDFFSGVFRNLPRRYRPNDVPERFLPPV